LKCKNNSDATGLDTDLGKDNMRYNPSKPLCKSPEEINEYIRDIELEHYVVEQQIYWLNYGKKPVYTEMKRMSFQLLNPDWYYRNWVYLR
jgi:hypothetical protein